MNNDAASSAGAGAAIMISLIKYFVWSLLCLNGLILLFGLHAASAQPADAEEEGNWTFLVEPYLMFPSMNGETGIGNSLVMDVDAGPEDIFSNLQMGAMLYLEAKTEQWAISSDLVYLDLNQDITPGYLLESGDVTAKQLVWEQAVLYRVNSFWEVGAGGRLNGLQMEVDTRINTIPTGTEDFSGRKTKIWYDPIFVTRLSTDLQEKWQLQFRGDIGGFGIGSDLTWQLQAYIGYRFSKLFQLTAGYRILSTDYSSGRAPRDFLFDMREYGPVIRFGFNF